MKNEAQAWYRNLSINQMKAFEQKHFPNCSSWFASLPSNVQRMWELEGKPQPQALIPVG